MLDRELVVTIAGTPAPKGSLKCIGSRGGRHQLIEDNTRTRPWRETVTAACRRLLRPNTGDGQPVGVEVTFVFRRPASHYGTGRATLDTVKSSAPRYPVTRSVGDVDKLARTVLDALQDGEKPILTDDSQVVELVARKRWTDHMPADRDPGARPSFLDWDAITFPGIVLRIYPIT